MSARTRCIYCLQEKVPEEFNKEHVLNDAFFKHSNPLNIIRCVCTDCNGRFGKTIDRQLARDTWEGFLRYIKGVKDPISSEDFTGRQLDLRVEEEGPYYDAIVVLSVNDDMCVQVVPVPQIGFRKTGERKWISYRLSEFLTEEGTEIPQCEEVRLLAVSEDDEAVAKARLRLRDVVEPQSWKTGSWHPNTNDGKLLVHQLATINEDICRAVAKIAFNYAAAKEGAEFATQSCFDAIRDFVKNGGETRCFVDVTAGGRILTNDYGDLGGHIITLKLHNSGTVQSLVSIFNSFTYRVTLTKRFNGLWRRIAHGRYYDHESGDIKPVMDLDGLWIPEMLRQKA